MGYDDIPKKSEIDFGLFSQYTNQVHWQSQIYEVGVGFDTYKV